MGNMIFGIVILLACLIPFILLSLNKSGHGRKMAKIFHEMVTGIGLKPGQFEVSGNLILGLNDEASHFFYYKERDGNVEKQDVQLTKFMQCTAHSSAGATGLTASSSSPVQKVSLHFVPRDKSTSEVHVHLFELSKDLQLNDELRLAEKWAQKIQGILQKK